MYTITYKEAGEKSKAALNEKGLQALYQTIDEAIFYAQATGITIKKLESLTIQREDKAEK